MKKKELMKILKRFPEETEILIEGIGSVADIESNQTITYKDGSMLLVLSCVGKEYHATPTQAQGPAPVQASDEEVENEDQGN